MMKPQAAEDVPALCMLMHPLCRVETSPPTRAPFSPAPFGGRAESR